MKLLDKLVLKELVPMFCIGMMLFFSLWFAAGPLLKATDYLSKGFAWFIVLHFLALSIPVVLAFTFPMAIVLAVLTGFGRISGDSEAVAMYAGGIPFGRVAAPAVFLGIIASFIGFFIVNYLSTSASRQLNDMKQYAFKEIQTDQTIQLPPQLSSDGHLQSTVTVGRGVEARSGILRQVTITMYDRTGAPVTVIYADSAKYVAWPVFELRNVQITSLGEHAAYSHVDYMQTSNINEKPAAISFLSADSSTLTFADLRRQVSALRASGNISDAHKAELAMWHIVALPLASLVFAMIGSPLGLRPQRTNKAAGWGLAVLIIFGYYVLYMVTGNISEGGNLPPIAAAFAPDIVGLIVGGTLVFRAAT